MSAARSPAKILIVDADPSKLQALKVPLTTAAYYVTSATSAAFALTTLERDRPDLIVSGGRTEDLDGVEFCSIIRSNPITHDIPFLLLSGPTRPTSWAVAQAGVDMLLAGDFVVSAVLDRISKLLRHVAPRAEPGLPPPLPPRVTVPRAEAGTRTFEGSFGVLDLAEVTQAIALGGKTGRLSLQLTAGEGSLLFDSGQVVHAEFASRTGESAFAAMVSAAQSDSEGTFLFKPAAAGAFSSTGALARLLGEEEFTVLFHQGKKESIHVSTVDDHAILLAIFGGQTTVGMVRLFAKEAATVIGQILIESRNKPRTIGDLSAPLTAEESRTAFGEPTKP